MKINVEQAIKRRISEKISQVLKLAAERHVSYGEMVLILEKER